MKRQGHLQDAGAQPDQRSLLHRSRPRRRRHRFPPSAQHGPLERSAAPET